MAFFTRKGLTVPEFPRDSILTEEPEEPNLPPTPPSLVVSDELACGLSPDETKDSLLVSISSNSNSNAGTNETADATAPKRFDYVVDRNYGVEV